MPTQRTKAAIESDDVQPTHARLPGEGETQIIERTRVRRECDNCGEPAFYRNTYLMPGARANPASSAYGRDDCSWCADYEEFLCGGCHERSIQVAVPDDYRWCSTFFADRMPHLFLRWKDRVVSDEVDDPTSAAAE